MQWIEYERCLHISPNPYGQRAPMIQPSKTANLRAAPGAARRMRNHACPVRRGATGCDDEAFKPAPKKAPKPLCIADLGDTVQASAIDCENSGGGTRTPDTRIMIPLL
jgi:hypothetical protein